jgi:hypothetical protein
MTTMAPIQERSAIVKKIISIALGDEDLEDEEMLERAQICAQSRAREIPRPRPAAPLGAATAMPPAQSSPLSHTTSASSSPGRGSFCAYSDKHSLPASQPVSTSITLFNGRHEGV